jgi:hypothetical protein
MRDFEFHFVLEILLRLNLRRILGECAGRGNRANGNANGTNDFSRGNFSLLQRERDEKNPENDKKL